jgi:RNA-directed DNA polymerase
MSLNNDMRQNIQSNLDFSSSPTGEAQRVGREESESLRTTSVPESPARTDRMMEEIVERENLKAALRRVKANKGAPGVDGMTVNQLDDHLKQHWPAIREQLLSGTYRPKSVKRVEIPKPDGGVRKLGIPTVLDRFIQQAVMQVLQQRWDPEFSNRSYGFRPGRSAHQAVAQAQQYIAEGYGWCVDLDLEKFFDNVQHSLLLEKVARRVQDDAVMHLLKMILKATGKKGVPQGGVITPLTQKVMLAASPAWR